MSDTKHGSAQAHGSTLTTVRHQRGSVRIKSESWYGSFNEYVHDPLSDITKRVQRCVKLGPKSLKRWQAFKLLEKEIDRTLGPSQSVRPDSRVTLKWFVREVWIPLKEGRWRGKGTVDSAEYILGLILKTFHDFPLEKLNRVPLQIWINALAMTHSDSVVKHARIYLKNILEEAVDLDYLTKNPAKKLELPHTRAVCKATLTREQLTAVLAELSPQMNLLFRTGVIEALRPGELLALRWRDFDPHARVFHIRETIYRGRLRPFTKTTREGSGEAHLLTVAIPDVLAAELEQYRAGLTLWNRDEDYIFATRSGKFFQKDNLLNRVLYPLRDKLGIPVLNFQVLRRSMATFAQHSGSIKDVQGHLRHRKPDTTASVYMQTVPESARAMVNTVYDSLVTKTAT
jgi:integrase